MHRLPIVVPSRILQVPTYVTYDPYEPSIEVRCLQDQRYVLQTANDSGRYWIPELELNLGIWYGERLSQTTNWLHWWDAQGNLLLWSAEHAEQERLRAEQAESLLEQERQQVEQTRRDAIAFLTNLGLTLEQIAEARSPFS